MTVVIVNEAKETDAFLNESPTSSAEFQKNLYTNHDSHGSHRRLCSAYHVASYL